MGWFKFSYGGWDDASYCMVDGLMQAFLRWMGWCKFSYGGWDDASFYGGWDDASIIKHRIVDYASLIKPIDGANMNK